MRHPIPALFAALMAASLLLPAALKAQEGLEFQNPSVVIPVDLSGTFNRFNLAIPAFQPLGSGGTGESERWNRRLGLNLDMTGYFLLLDPRASMESNPRAGLFDDAPMDYAPWAQIGANYVIKGGVQASGSRVTMEMRLFEVSTGTQKLAKRYTGPIKEARQMINRFTNEVILAVTGEPGVFGTKIIFLSGESVMMTELGSDEAFGVGGGGFGVMHPTLGHGNRTAWTRRTKRGCELVVDGKVQYRGELVIAPAFMADGTVAAGFSGDSSTNIAVFSGRSPRVITHGGGIEISPTFSPDGSRMAYVSDQGGSAGIYVGSVSGGGGTRVSPGGKSTDPSWSPKGDKIAFVVREHDVAVIDAGGGGYTQLTGGQGVNRHPSFSPDGRMIVFSSTRGGRSQLYVMAANGDRQQPLIPEFAGSQSLPSWSPDMPEQ
jgi:TolB protein